MNGKRHYFPDYLRNLDLSAPGVVDIDAGATTQTVGDKSDGFTHDTLREAYRLLGPPPDGPFGMGPRDYLEFGAGVADLLKPAPDQGLLALGALQFKVNPALPANVVVVKGADGSFKKAIIIRDDGDA